jgi:hypothetical protein
MKLRLGADPELFLVDAAGALIASCGLIGGTKAEPLPLELGDGFAVQEDNVALEYNIPASESKEQFTNNIGRAMSYLSDMVATKGLAFSKLSAALFPEDQLYHPLAQEFGCDPDFNAWKKGATNPRPKADDHTLRTCGGHVHYGMIPNDLSKKDVLQFIKHVDLFLGVPSVLLDNGELRKQLYGKAGAFRSRRHAHLMDFLGAGAQRCIDLPQLLLKIGGRAEELRSHRNVLGHPLASAVHVAYIVEGPGIAFCRGQSEQAQSFCVIGSDAQAIFKAVSQHFLAVHLLLRGTLC